tara:strand:- start:147 stop:815 length:669 start_codon:yes stop_codon:yes gene_type:complete
MKVILCIETSSKNCSVSIIKKDKIIDFSDNVSLEYSHSEKITSIIIELLKNNKVSFKDLCAVAISGGPGSYTGLRIGTSVAKGLCYSLNIPLISVSTLFSMSSAVKKIHSDCIYCPMVDARRMEVYTALYDNNLNFILKPAPVILESELFNNYLNKYKIYFFGDGALKFKKIINHANANFIVDFFPSARFMSERAYVKYNKSDFVDIAYYEPDYLKEFYFKT